MNNEDMVKIAILSGVEFDNLVIETKNRMLMVTDKKYKRSHFLSVFYQENIIILDRSKYIYAQLLFMSMFFTDNELKIEINDMTYNGLVCEIILFDYKKWLRN